MTTPLENGADAATAELARRLSGWVNAPMADATRERMGAALVDAMPSNAASAAHTAASQPEASKAEVDLVPMNGLVWVRRPGAKSFVPCSSVQHLAEGTTVQVPQDARAHVHYGDGSLLLLGASTRMQVLPADEPRAGQSGSGRMHAHASLETGRVFAWIARQSTGQFAIRTTRGCVSVLGTEFDLEQRDDESLQLVVAAGRVRYSETLEESDSPGVAVDVTLGAGQLLQVPAGSRASSNRAPVVPRVLTARELRRHVAWSTGGASPLRGIRGGAMLKALGVITCVAVLVLLYLGYENRGIVAAPATAPVRSPVAAASSPAIVASAATSPVAPAGAPASEEIISTADVEGKKGTEWVPMQSIQAGRRIIETKSDGSIVMEATLHSEKSSAAAGTTAGDMSRLVGKPVRFTVAPDGQIEDVNLPELGKTADPRSLIMFVEMMHHTWMFSLPEAALRAAKPGQQWDRKAAGSLAKFPGVSYAFNVSIKYEGPEADAKGTMQSKFTYKGTGTLGGIVLRDDNRNGRGVRLTLSEYKTEENGAYQRASTGHVVSGESFERRSLTVAQTNTAPNVAPSTRTLPPDIQERRIMMSVGGQK